MMRRSSWEYRRKKHINERNQEVSQEGKQQGCNGKHNCSLETLMIIAMEEWTREADDTSVIMYIAEFVREAGWIVCGLGGHSIS